MKDFKHVKDGDIVRQKVTGNAYQVGATMGCDDQKILILIRTIMATNPEEWERVGACEKVESI